MREELQSRYDGHQISQAPHRTEQQTAQTNIVSQVSKREEDPEYVFKKDVTEYMDNFLNDSDAPSYKNHSAQQLKRKQDAVKAIITALSSNKYGGGFEED